ncbi:adhesion G protein-coupled receptor L2-like [Glandiceps talaboti]
MVGIEQTDKKIVCSVIAGLLHYFFLACFAWMSLEGIQIYVLLIEVFEAKKSRKKYYYPYGYGLPAIVVGVSAGIFYQGYGTSEYCWLTTEKGLIWAFVGPACAVILVNLIFLIMAGVIMCRHSGHVPCKQDDSGNKEKLNCSESPPETDKMILGKTKGEEILSWLKGACVLLCLLGITWAFGLLYINSETIVMAYIFTISNAFQGFFIFVFHCCMNEKVKKEYKRCIRHCRCCPACIRDRYGSSGYSNQGQGSSASSNKRLHRPSSDGYPSTAKRNSASSISQNLANVTATSASRQQLLPNGSLPEYLPVMQAVGTQTEELKHKHAVKKETGHRTFNVPPLELKRTSSDPCILSPLPENGFSPFIFNKNTDDAPNKFYQCISSNGSSHNSMPNLTVKEPQTLRKKQELDLVDRKILQNRSLPDILVCQDKDVSLMHYRKVGSDWNIHTGNTYRTQSGRGNNDVQLKISHIKILDSEGKPWSRISVTPVTQRKNPPQHDNDKQPENVTKESLFPQGDRSKTDSEGSVVLKKWKTSEDIALETHPSSEQSTHLQTDGKQSAVEPSNKIGDNTVLVELHNSKFVKTRASYFETYL